jgi:glyoxylase-like metal-dependent hydrolase (beta-lactamase superfamily II)
VETGIGSKWREKDREIYAIREEPGGLPGALSRLGVDPDAVDTVILTHLHFDHAGGATIAATGADPVPAFPAAEFVVQKMEWVTATHPNERTRASYLSENYEPLARAGRLRLVEGETEVAPGVFTMPLPGHTPGLQGVRIEGGGRVVLYPSDLVPTAAHLPYPYIMGYDLFPLTTLATKKRVLPKAASEGWVLVLVHEPETPVGELSEAQGRMTLRPFEGEDR